MEKKVDKVKAKEFRHNKARGGHPAYIVKVFKETILNEKNKEETKKAKFIGITEAKKTHGTKNVQLDKNPEPKNKKTAFVRPIVEEVNLTKKTFGKKLEGWEFAVSDKEKIRIIIDKNKKS